MNRAISAAFSALVACLLLLGACAARAQDLDKPLLLVATPDLQGPYAHTALILVPLFVLLTLLPVAPILRSS